MNFIELWLALLRFNYSISIQYRLTACTWARKCTADDWLTSSRRLLCAFLAWSLKMASKEILERCERFRRKRRKLSTSINIVEWSGGYPEVTRHDDRSSAAASSASICRFSSSSCHFWKGILRGEWREMARLFPFYSRGASAGKVSSRQPFQRFRPSASSSGPQKSFKPKETWTYTFICLCESGHWMNDKMW